MDDRTRSCTWDVFCEHLASYAEDEDFILVVQDDIDKDHIKARFVEPGQGLGAAYGRGGDITRGPEKPLEGEADRFLVVDN